MSEYVQRLLARRPAAAFGLDDAMLDRIRSMRAEIRRDEGGGGMCHFVTEWLSHVYGLERLGVTYLGCDGEVAISSHYICLLADGSILDPTADQTGEGHDIRVLRPDDPEYGRYRPEFYSDFYPGSSEDEGRLDAWLPAWQGIEDHHRQRMIDIERGQGWWVDDPTELLAYYEMQVGMADDGYAKVVQGWIDDIRERHPGARGPAPSV